MTTPLNIKPLGQRDSVRHYIILGTKPQRPSFVKLEQTSRPQLFQLQAQRSSKTRCSDAMADITTRYNS